MYYLLGWKKHEEKLWEKIWEVVIPSGNYLLKVIIKTLEEGVEDVQSKK